MTVILTVSSLGGRSSFEAYCTRSDTCGTKTIYGAYRTLTLYFRRPEVMDDSALRRGTLSSKPPDPSRGIT